MFQPAQRIQVDLSGLTVQGVSFSQNVKRALGTIVRQISPARPDTRADQAGRGRQDSQGRTAQRSGMVEPDE
jgi:hypothetical protein